MPRLALAALFVAALGQVAHAQPVDDMHELPVVMPFQVDDQVTRGVTLFLNAGGGTLTGGWDDSASDVSSIAYQAGGDVVVPAWRGGRRAWREVVACVRDRFADFAVDVVTTRPAGDGYVMVMVGGRPSLLGFPGSIGGIAPYTGDVVPGAVAFVFAAGLDHDVEATCTSIIHEAGHTLGLDHAYHCEDPMSYLWGCGEKRFRDVDAACGEDEPRACGDGEVAQNSYRRLAAAVGLRDGAAEPEAEPPAPDDAPPVVAIDGGDDQLPGNRWVEVVVRAEDDDGIAEVELGWASETAQYVMACGDLPAEVPVECERAGGVFRFRVHAGTGLRAMVARATDRAGNQAVSEPRVVFLED